MGCAAATGAATAIDQSGAGSAVVHVAKGLCAEHFDSFVGKTFRVSPSAMERYPLKLVEVDRPEAKGFPTDMRSPFSLLFHAPKDADFQQCVTRLHNPGFGSFDALVVPVGFEDDRRLFEVVIS